MYLDYLREREPNVSIIQEDDGFLLYHQTTYNEQEAYYITDVYIKPEARKTSLATDMATQVEEFAISNNIKLIIGSVVPSTTNSTISVQVLISYGMKLLSSSEDIIYFYKEV